MRRILNITFGSHLYGTSTPASDFDYKCIHIPDAEDILLQRATGAISNKRPKADGEKNVAGVVDEESYSLHKYLSLLAEGQTVAIDMLFSPVAHVATPEWHEIYRNRHRLLTNKAASFLGYCRTQANKYGIKGSRVAASRSALKLLDGYCEHGAGAAKLGAACHAIFNMVESTDHMSLVEIPQAAGPDITFWDVCGRKLSYRSTIKNARDVVQRLVDEYGKRALMAEAQDGIDWKALSHAVRIGRQAIELLQTAHVTFPLPYADHIVAIKSGLISYQEVANEIEDLLEQVEVTSQVSALQDEPDIDWIERFVCRVYGNEVSDWMNDVRMAA